jgi:DNA-directed RNA polymerase subunit RPC12/RpoP
MKCPNCGSVKVLSNVTVAWVQIRASILPERGYFCTSCSKPFRARQGGDIALSTVRVSAISPALLRLQENADLVVVRHRAGVKEVIY